MSKIPFSVSARTASLIGKENFANAEGAIIELVKNSYDADASKAIILFDNGHDANDNNAIYIIDNGIGMSDLIIRKHWMMIGTDIKEDEYKTNNGRIKTGAKGIGRFALNRLGEIAEMYSKPSFGEEGYYWKVNWNDFLEKRISISDVKATLKNTRGDLFYKKIRKLGKSVNSLHQHILKNKVDFHHGTILKISNLRDKWDNYNITKLFSNLSILLPPKEQSSFNIALFSKVNPLDFGVLPRVNFDDFDYQINAEYEALKNNEVIITIFRNELDKNRVRNEYLEVFEKPPMDKFPYDLSTFMSDEFLYTTTLPELVKGISDVDKKGLLNKIGAFNFNFYFLKNTKSDDKEAGSVKYPYKDFNSSSRRLWLKKFGGIKIFRDGFRVRPYGEYGEDWLKLGERQAQSPQGAGQRKGAYRIRPNQISGTVNISRISNNSFQDKSGREGIQENEVFALFKEILVGVISQFEKDRNTIMLAFSTYYKKQNAIEEAKQKAAQESKRILDAAKSEDKEITKKNARTKNQIDSDKEQPTEVELTLAKGYHAQEVELDEKDSEIRLLRSLSGAGLIVVSFAHELRSLRALLKSRTEDLITILEKLLSEEALKTIKPEWNPFRILNFMRDQDEQIVHWLDYSLSAIIKDKRTRSNIDMSDYFKSLKEMWFSSLKRRVVDLELIDNLIAPIKITGYAIDFDTVFNNLIVNSLDSFKKSNDKKNRLISIRYSIDNNQLSIQFSDNGVGLSDDYRKTPDDIFLPFETSKVDMEGKKIGTGIGLYLAKSIIDDYKGDIEIVEIDVGFSLKITLPLGGVNG